MYYNYMHVRTYMYMTAFWTLVHCQPTTIFATCQDLSVSLHYLAIKEWGFCSHGIPTFNIVVSAYLFLVCLASHNIHHR